jgi:hypothetical protein
MMQTTCILLDTGILLLVPSVAVARLPLQFGAVV